MTVDGESLADYMARRRTGERRLSPASAGPIRLPSPVQPIDEAELMRRVWLARGPFALAWRSGDRVCVACGESPAGRGVSWPTDSFLGAFTDPGIRWTVPTCLMHRKPAYWPVMVMLALYDAMCEVVGVAHGPGVIGTRLLVPTAVEAAERVAAA